MGCNSFLTSLYSSASPPPPSFTFTVMLNGCYSSILLALLFTKTQSSAILRHWATINLQRRHPSVHPPTHSSCMIVCGAESRRGWLEGWWWSGDEKTSEKLGQHYIVVRRVRDKCGACIARCVIWSVSQLL